MAWVLLQNGPINPKKIKVASERTTINPNPKTNIDFFQQFLFPKKRMSSGVPKVISNKEDNEVILKLAQMDFSRKEKEKSALKKIKEDLLNQKMGFNESQVDSNKETKSKEEAMGDTGLNSGLEYASSFIETKENNERTRKKTLKELLAERELVKNYVEQLKKAANGPQAAKEARVDHYKRIEEFPRVDLSRLETANAKTTEAIKYLISLRGITDDLRKTNSELLMKLTQERMAKNAHDEICENHLREMREANDKLLKTLAEKKRASEMNAEQHRRATKELESILKEKERIEFYKEQLQKELAEKREKMMKEMPSEALILAQASTFKE